MIGYNYARKPVSGEFALQMRDAVRRITTRNYNDIDIASMRRHEDVMSKVTIVYSTEPYNG